MTARKQKRALGASAAALIGLIAWYVPSAAAHENTEHSADCEQVTGSFADFPDGENTVDVQGDGGTAVHEQFTGSSGTVQTSWTDLGVDTSDGQGHTYMFTWDADGGGSAGPFTFDAADCADHEEPTTTTSTTAPPKPQPKPQPTVVSPAAQAAPAAPSFTG